MMAFFNGKKKSKWLLAAILAITLIATYAVPMSVFAEDAVPAEGDGNGDQQEIMTMEPTWGINLDKSVDPEVAAPGDTVTYTFTVTNTGNMNLSNVTITDTKLGDNPKFKIGELESHRGHNTATVHVNYTVPTDAAIGSTIINNATVTGSRVAQTSSLETADIEKIPTSYEVMARDEASASLQVVKPYDISLVKTVSPEKASPGDMVKYNFEVTNTGANDLAYVILTDPKLGEDWNLKIDDLKVGKTKTRFAYYMVPTSAAIGSTITNTATADGYDVVQSSSVDSDIEHKDRPSYGVVATAADSADLAVVAPYAITLEKTVSTELASPGDKVTYTFKVTNTGTKDLKKVTIVDDKLGSNPKFNLETIHAGDSVTKTVEFKIPADAPFGLYTNTATVTGYIEQRVICDESTIENHDGRYQYVAGASATDSAEVNLVPPYALTLEKTVDVSEAVPGTEVTYSFTITNTGSKELKDLQLTDTKLGSTWGVTIPAIAVGADETVTAKHVIPTDTAIGSDYVNIAQVVAKYKLWVKDETPQYPPYPNIPQSVSISCIDPPEQGHEVDMELVATDSAIVAIKSAIVPVYGITLEKTVSPSAVAPGEAVQYSFKVTNTGNQTLYGVVLTDPMFGYTDNVVSYIGMNAILNPGQSETIIPLPYTVPSDYTGTELTNTATVTGFTGRISSDMNQLILDWINGNLDGESSENEMVYWFEENSVQATDSAIVTVDQGNEPNTPNRTTRRTATTTVTEPIVPGTPEVTPEISVIQDQIPAAPLPKTGGVAPYLLYGLGLLLAGGGVTMKARNKKDKAE